MKSQITNKIKFKLFSNTNSYPIRIVSFSFLCLYLFTVKNIYAQHHYLQKDSLNISKDEAQHLDSIKPVISNVIISGNKITKDEVITREMVLVPGKQFTIAKCKLDQMSIYNLGLFTKVDLIPVLQEDKKVFLHVNVQEHWYIFPMPFVELTDGELRKLTAGLSIRWQNFRGMNENVSLNFGIGYNRFIRAGYSNPWIGEKAHIYTRLSGGIAKENNRSLLAVGRINGERTISYRDTNFDYVNNNIRFNAGKFFSSQLSAYIETGYTYLKVSDYSFNRTVSPDGTDKYMLTGIGFNFDSRNIREYTTEGYSINTDFQYYNYLNVKANFARFNFEQRSFIPLRFSPDYFITLALKLYASIAMGPVLPYYNHKILGYGEDFVRGWSRFGFEGENDLTLYNEIRIPLLQPSYLEGKQLPLVKKIKYLNKMSYKYGLYFVMFYDIGGIWNKEDNPRDTRFQSGTGIGLDAILPFGLVGKVDWAFRLATPTVGQVVFGVGAKF